MKKIKELENKIEQLELENENKLQSNSVSITEPPSGGKVQFFGANKNITIADGKIPSFSKGVYIPNNKGTDAILIAIDITGGNKLITAIKANNNWQAIRTI